MYWWSVIPKRYKRVDPTKIDVEAAMFEIVKKELGRKVVACLCAKPWPGVNTLADSAGFPRTTVRRLLNMLQAIGFIEESWIPRADELAFKWSKLVIISKRHAYLCSDLFEGEDPEEICGT